MSKPIKDLVFRHLVLPRTDPVHSPSWCLHRPATSWALTYSTGWDDGARKGVYEKVTHSWEQPKVNFQDSCEFLDEFTDVIQELQILEANLRLKPQLRVTFSPAVLTL